MKARFILYLPVAVFRKRFAAPRFVFILGMISSERDFPIIRYARDIPPGCWLERLSLLVQAPT